MFHKTLFLSKSKSTKKVKTMTSNQQMHHFYEYLSAKNESTKNQTCTVFHFPFLK